LKCLEKSSSSFNASFLTAVKKDLKSLAPLDNNKLKELIYRV
jgi:hypothetical protein